MVWLLELPAFDLRLDGADREDIPGRAKMSSKPQEMREQATETQRQLLDWLWSVF